MPRFRRWFFLIVALAAAAFPLTARASWILDADIGRGMPTGSFDDFWSSGFHGGIAASYLLSPRFAVGADGSYTSFGPSDDYQALLDFLDPGAENTFSIWHLGVHGKWMVPFPSEGRLHPYLVVGAGMYDMSDAYESDALSDELGQSAFGFRGGAGVDYWISPKLGLGVDLNYHETFTSEDEIGHDSTPFVTFTAGLRWKLGSAP